MNAGDIKAALASSMGEAVIVRPRRPGLYQVTVPAFLIDRDPAAVFVRPMADGRVRVTDVGQTSMRISYTRKLTPDVLEALGSLASLHGIALDEGELSAVVQPDEVLAATMALVQVQTAAEVSIAVTVRRRASAEQFRREVQDILKEAFRESCLLNFFDAANDSEALWKMDAVIRGPRTDIAVAILGGTTEAERAVGTAAHIRHALRAHQFLVAVPRDINELPDLTRKRVMTEYLVPVPSFSEQRGVLPDRIRQFLA